MIRRAVFWFALLAAISMLQVTAEANERFVGDWVLDL